MYYHKVYHGELGISMPCSLGSLYQALQITVLPINVSSQAQGCLSQSPAQPCAPSQLSVSFCEACWSQYLQVTPSGAERSLWCVAQQGQVTGRDCEHMLVYLHTRSSVRVHAELAKREVVQEHPQRAPTCSMSDAMLGDLSLSLGAI